MKGWKRLKRTLLNKKYSKRNNWIKLSKKLLIKCILMFLNIWLIKSNSWLSNWKAKRWLLYFKKNYRFLWSLCFKLIKTPLRFSNFPTVNRLYKKIYWQNFYKKVIMKIQIFMVQDWMNFCWNQKRTQTRVS